jgi:hypothetical protein
MLTSASHNRILMAMAIIAPTVHHIQYCLHHIHYYPHHLQNFVLATSTVELVITYTWRRVPLTRGNFFQVRTNGFNPPVCKGLQFILRESVLEIEIFSTKITKILKNKPTLLGLSRIASKITFHVELQEKRAVNCGSQTLHILCL